MEEFKDKVLMCKNTPVYDIENNIVVNKELLPGAMKSFPCYDTFQKWMKARYSAGTNTFSRMLRQRMLSVQGEREKIDLYSHALSYSDCYWLKSKTDDVFFEKISPYYSDFWDGEGEYEKGKAVPTLYVPGAISKQWKKDGRLYKIGDELEIELDCIELCKVCKVLAEDGYKYVSEKEHGIVLLNFTNANIMLEQANMSGLIDEENFSDSDIVRIFGIEGIKMLTVDAIVGNGDRHAGNFGFLRNSNNGEYLGMAPLYDFDHALDSTTTSRVDALMESLDQFFAVEEYREEIKRICLGASDFRNDIFAKRAIIILKMIEMYEAL